MSGHCRDHRLVLCNCYLDAATCLTFELITRTFPLGLRTYKLVFQGHELRDPEFSIIKPVPPLPPFINDKTKNRIVAVCVVMHYSVIVVAPKYYMNSECNDKNQPITLQSVKAIFPYKTVLNLIRFSHDVLS